MSLAVAIINRLKSIPELANAASKLDELAKDARFVAALDDVGQALETGKQLEAGNMAHIKKLVQTTGDALGTSPIGITGEQRVLQELLKDIPAEKQGDFIKSYQAANTVETAPVVAPVAAPVETAPVAAPVAETKAPAVKQETPPVAAQADQNPYAGNNGNGNVLAQQEIMQTRTKTYLALIEKYNKTIDEWSAGRFPVINNILNGVKGIHNGTKSLEEQVASLRGLISDSAKIDSVDATPAEFAGFVSRSGMNAEVPFSDLKWLVDLPVEKLDASAKLMRTSVLNITKGDDGKEIFNGLKLADGQPKYAVAWDHSDLSAVKKIATEDPLFRTTPEDMEKLWRWSDDRINKYVMNFGGTTEEAEKLRGQPLSEKEMVKILGNNMVPMGNLGIATTPEYVVRNADGSIKLDDNNMPVKDVVPLDVRIGGLFSNATLGNRLTRAEYDNYINTVLRPTVYDRIVERRVTELDQLRKEIENSPANFDENMGKIDTLLNKDINGVTLVQMAQDKPYTKISKDRMEEVAKSEKGAPTSALEQLRAGGLTDPSIINQVRFEMSMIAMEKRYDDIMINLRKFYQDMEAGNLTTASAQDRINQIVKNTDGGPSLEELAQNKSFMDHLAKRSAEAEATKKADAPLTAKTGEPSLVTKTPETILETLKSGKLNSLDQVADLALDVRGRATEKLMVERLAELRSMYDIALKDTRAISTDPARFHAIFNGDEKGPGLIRMADDKNFQQYLEKRNGEMAQSISSNRHFDTEVKTPKFLMENITNGKAFSVDDIRVIRQNMEAVLLPKNAANQADAAATGKFAPVINAIKSFIPFTGDKPSPFWRKRDLVAAMDGRDLPSVKAGQRISTVKTYALAGTLAAGTALGVGVVGSSGVILSDPLYNGPAAAQVRTLASIPNIPFLDNPATPGDGLFDWSLNRHLNNSDMSELQRAASINAPVFLPYQQAIQDKMAKLADQERTTAIADTNSNIYQKALKDGRSFFGGEDHATNAAPSRNVSSFNDVSPGVDYSTMVARLDAATDPLMGGYLTNAQAATFKADWQRVAGSDGIVLRQDESQIKAALDSPAYSGLSQTAKRNLLDIAVSADLGQ